jgi:integrase
MSRHNAGYVVKKAAKAIGQKDITPHQFRHWRASQLVNAGIPLDVVQDYLGHRSVETTRRFYARTDPGRVDEAVHRVSLPEQR